MTDPKDAKQAAKPVRDRTNGTVDVRLRSAVAKLAPHEWKSGPHVWRIDPPLQPGPSP